MAMAQVIPPWADTVCERVGNTFEISAVLKPDCASCSEARMPAPPPPTMTASKVMVLIDIVSSSPDHPQAPQHVAHQQQCQQGLCRQTHTGGGATEGHAGQVVSGDGPEPHPGVGRNGQDHQGVDDFHRHGSHQRVPGGIVHARTADEIAEQTNGIDAEQDRAEPLDKPVGHAVTAETRDAGYHTQTPASRMRTTETMNTRLAPRRPPSRLSPMPRSMIRCLMPATR